MNDDFWAPVFARLHEDIELLRLICHDSKDSELLSWVKPNPLLWGRCARYMARKKIARRDGLIEEILNFAKKEPALRKIIFFNWVEKNPAPMSLFSLKSDDETFSRLINGEFGGPAKVKILEKIDPREGVAGFYQRYFAAQTTAPQAAAESGDEAASSSPDPGVYLSQIEALKSELKESRQAFAQRAAEISGLQKALQEREQRLNLLDEEKQKLQEEINGLQRERITISPEHSTHLMQLRETQNQQKEKIIGLSQQLDELVRQNHFLKEQLRRKESALNAVTAQNNAMKTAIRNDDDQERKIETLRNLVQSLDQSDIERRVSGQLVCVGEAKKKWFLTSFGGDLVDISAAMVREAECCQAEFCTAGFSGNDELISLESLESEKLFKTGYVVEKDEQQFLCDGEQEYPIWCEISGKDISRPGRGIFLNSFHQRPAGIYELFFINDETRKVLQNQTAANKTRPVPESARDTCDFQGKKLLILGGDYVGHEYRKALEAHNLNITWQSGFTNLGHLAQGLSEFDLVIIILRQISHTLLRETVKAGQKNKVPLLYCKKRGISGLLVELKEHFNL